MERYVWEDYENTVTLEQLLARLKVVDNEDAELMAGLFGQACGVVRAKSVMRVCYVEERRGDELRIDGEWFQSPTLARNLAGLHRVFAYVVTCGREVDEWSAAQSRDDPILGIWLDMLKELFLGDARRQFFERLERRWQTGSLSGMAPGSGNLDTWPIGQQVPLFRLIGEVERDAGVTLTDSLLMLPTKSVSGLAFPKDRAFVSCAVCRREHCPNRQVPYDPDFKL